MKCPDGKGATLFELADLALNHGNEGSGKHVEFADKTLSNWYEQQRKLAAVLLERADLALVHGNMSGKPPKPKEYRQAA